MHTPTGTGWLRSFAIGSLLVAALLTGCSGESEKPGTLPSESASPTSSSPSPTPTPVEQQVEAAVRAYYAELTRAAKTNDTSRLRLMLDKNCPCYRAVRVIDRGARRGESTPKAVWSLQKVRVHDVTGAAAVAEVRYSVTAYDVIDGHGKKVDHIAARSSHLDLSLVLSGRSWEVANVFDLEGE